MKNTLIVLKMDLGASSYWHETLHQAREPENFSNPSPQFVVATASDRLVEVYLRNCITTRSGITALLVKQRHTIRILELRDV